MLRLAIMDGRGLGLSSLERCRGVWLSLDGPMCAALTLGQSFMQTTTTRKATFRKLHPG